MKKYRLTLLTALSFFYLAPLLCLARWANFSSFLLGGYLLWILLGLAVVLSFIRFIEKQMKGQVSSLVSSRIHLVEKKVLGKQTTQPKIDLRRVQLLSQEIENKSKAEKEYLKEIERLKSLHHYQEREYATLNEDLQNQLDKKETILFEYRSTLKEQRKIIEKKQEEMNILQIRVNDLKYELENVLKIKHEEGEPDFFQDLKKEEKPIEPSEEIPSLMESIQEKLDRYVKMAVRLNGAHHFARQDVKYPDLSLGNLIIDQRRLFDRLQNEEYETILVYSREEKRLIFINQQIKYLLGWSPEKFLKDFSFLVQKGYSQWSEALEDVKLDHQKSIRMLIKTRAGKDVLTHCHLKEVPQGIFKGYVLGILSSATH